MKRSLKVLLVGAVAAAVIAGAAHAIAGRHRGGGSWMKAAVQAHIDEALDAAKATPAQRQAIAAARDHVFDTFAELHQDRRTDFETALTLFSAEKIDPAKVTEQRAKHEAEAKKIGDAIVQAVSDAHAALTAPQRKAIVEYVRANHPKGDPAKHHSFMKRMVQNRIDSAL